MSHQRVTARRFGTFSGTTPDYTQLTRFTEIWPDVRRYSGPIVFAGLVVAGMVPVETRTTTAIRQYADGKSVKRAAFDSHLDHGGLLHDGIIRYCHEQESFVLASRVSSLANMFCRATGERMSVLAAVVAAGPGRVSTHLVKWRERNPANHISRSYRLDLAGSGPL